MQIFTECNLAQIVSELLSGKTLVFPTETSYGLGCDATSQEAVDKIFKIKGRSSDKPLLVVVPSVRMAKKYLVWNEMLEKIAKKYWPGAVTVVAEYQISNSLLSVGKYKYQNLASRVVSQDNTVAIRVTAHPLLASITEKLGRPLVATSANVADRGDLYSAPGITEQFKTRDEQPDIMLDYGELPVRQPTTIVSVTGGKAVVVRQGEVTVNI